MKRCALAIAILALVPLLGAPPKRTPGRTKGSPKPAAPQPTPPAGDPDVPAAGATGELLDPVKGTPQSIGPMAETRQAFQATAMPDGRVLVTGGSPLPTSEWFDPAARTFSPGPRLGQPRTGHLALRLKDGACLLVGGTDAPAPAEVLDPGATSFRPLPGDARFGLVALAAELDDGRVLLVDEMGGKSWIWDRLARKPLREADDLSSLRAFARLTRLKDGRVLLTGGLPVEAAGPRRRKPSLAPTPSEALPAEVFNPQNARWSRLKATLLPRARHHATLLPDGRILLLGGHGGETPAPVAALEVLDAARDRVEHPGALASPGVWAETERGGFWLPENSLSMLAVTDPRTLGQAPDASKAARLANAYLEPLLVPLPDGRVLVLGTPHWGAELERWDARTGCGHLLGSLRHGTRSLAALPDGRILALGTVVDLVDPRTGRLTPLGWPETMEALLRHARTLDAKPSPDHPGALVVPLDKGRRLVLGGSPASDATRVWDPRTRKLTPRGRLSSPRQFAGRETGAITLADGSVLFWISR